MIELLKILVEATVKLVSPEAIANARRRKKISAIGTELFILYSALNGTIVLGRGILEELEHGVPWMKRKVEEGEPERVLGSDLEEKIHQQLLLLGQFTNAFEDLALSLQVVEPEVAMSLMPIISGKINALRLLADAISPSENKTQLVSINEPQMRSLIKMAQSGDQEQLETLRNQSFMGGDLFNGLVIQEGLDVAHLTANQFPIVERYLSGKAKAELDELERLAKLMRASIEKNFSIQDILLNVGDKRAAFRRN